MKQYTSNAEWPEEACIADEFGKLESHDNHDLIGQAESVCVMLEKDGLGGQGKIFPIKTWVEER